MSVKIIFVTKLYLKLLKPTRVINACVLLISINGEKQFWLKFDKSVAMNGEKSASVVGVLVEFGWLGWVCLIVIVSIGDIMVAGKDWDVECAIVLFNDLASSIEGTFNAEPIVLSEIVFFGEHLLFIRDFCDDSSKTLYIVL